MKVISNGQTFDFDKVVALSYRTSVLGNGYPVEIKIGNNGFLHDVIEIARAPTANCAHQLVCTITEQWASNIPLFDVDKWLREYQCACK